MIGSNNMAVILPDRSFLDDSLIIHKDEGHTA